jgi:hypothetical protein
MEMHSHIKEEYQDDFSEKKNTVYGQLDGIADNKSSKPTSRDGNKTKRADHENTSVISKESDISSK